MNTYPYLSPLLFLILFMCQDTAYGKNATRKIEVGVILEAKSPVGNISLSCIRMALDDFYSVHKNYTTRLVLHTRDSKGDIVQAASAAIDLLKNEQVQAILGPQSSSEAEFVANIANKAQTPMISFSATSPSLSFNKTPYFIRTALSDSMQVKAIAAIVKAFGWREVVPIYEATPYGEDMIPYLTDAIENVGARIPHRSVISPLATDDKIFDELEKLKTMQTRVFVVHMNTPLGVRLFSKAKQAEMMSKGYVWIITVGLTDLLGYRNSSVFDSMQGVLGVRPYVKRSDELDNFQRRWRRKFMYGSQYIEASDLSVYGLWAYDSIWALAQAAETAETEGPLFTKPSNGVKSTDLDTVGISKTGPQLQRAILETSFSGLSGEFLLKDGQLQSSVFQIVNVIGKVETEMGFWSPDLGISRTGEPYGKDYSTSMKDLRTPIWPGDPKEVPKGWEASSTERKLKIGVPFGDGYSEFVKVDKDCQTNTTTITGFCIDVFRDVVAALPYAVPYELVPFEKDGHSAGTYDDLIDMLYNEKYDGVAGDATILANRSLHVDFTLPFTEAGVSMIVPIKEDHKSAWIFLKPLTKDLWLTTGAFFIFTGFVVWVLEHRVNKEFRGSPSRQVGMIFWFSFSTLVFAHKEKVVSNLSRFVLIIWVFVVLILTSSYTASLSSLLTVQQLQPTITDINDLIKNGDNIGYKEGSFVLGFLERLQYDTSKFKYYNTLEEYDEALSKGTKNGGISAVVDEIPYIKLFLSKYCTKYTMVGPTYKTAGFGFAFPKGSPLVPDMSRAILKVTEEGQMTKLEQKWFGKETQCREKGESTMTSNSLTLDSFRGLFIIAGAVSAFALLISFFVFLFEHKAILSSEGSVTQKMATIVKLFDKQKNGASKKIYASSPDGTIIQGQESDAADEDEVPLPCPVTSISIRLQQEDFSSELGTPIGDP